MPSSLTIFLIVNHGVWKNLMKCFLYENKNISLLLSTLEQRRIFLVVFVPEAYDCIERSLYLLFWFVGAYRGRQYSKAGSTRDFTTVVTGSLSQQSKLNITQLHSYLTFAQIVAISSSNLQCSVKTIRQSLGPPLMFNFVLVGQQS